jgi:hypothetical protein
VQSKDGHFLLFTWSRNQFYVNVSRLRLLGCILACTVPVPVPVPYTILAEHLGRIPAAIWASFTKTEMSTVLYKCEADVMGYGR